MDQVLKDDIKKMGKSIDRVEQQLDRFKNGFPYLTITKPATVGDGIIRLSDDDLDQNISSFERNADQYHITKFVPASGAASRMFKRLFSFLEEDESVVENDEFLTQFFDDLQHFAFAKSLDEEMQKNGQTLEEARKDKKYHEIVKALLLPEGLNYGQLPKGLLEFHKYGTDARTATAEHFAEGERYAKGKNGEVHLHFTVSPEHQEAFDQHVKELKQGYDKFTIDFSQQDPNTDTIAVTPDNEPFREDDGSILFRPAGHGALIENLNKIDADIVFVKNIDNVVPDHLKEPTVKYKKALGGLLIDTQQKLFAYVRELENEVNENQLKEIEAFAKDKLMLSFKSGYDAMSINEKATYLKQQLNRPLRVCGMVPNTGEPGGGPFWIEEKDGSNSLQIVETSQFNPDDKEAQGALQSATHFNPVDLICAFKDHNGSKFDLTKYVDPDTGFITEKSKSGKSLKALELPGLWNGAMSDWITLFVEVPIETFNPVKTVNDLLREQHQGV
ncbi:DUF4301 family protein [Fulvivirga sp. RKSG066]|uniref:DUF4301 family protein n=1 Tax=Fulvivirga aurantia TaxID=2529383 RepID=UPI0012BCED00|nr:DUF4301 family protein [Fulvivirga aurantia]MTI21898.1 DUF4301 family protein [Fulvivirga aurantia]